MIAAQPLVKKGMVISVRPEDGKRKLSARIQVGYYHIRARDMDEAVSLAKGNPEFEYGKTARIEVRQIKTEEEKTGFVYPE